MIVLMPGRCTWSRTHVWCETGRSSTDCPYCGRPAA